MAWLILVLAGFLEAVWATALGQSEGFTKTTPTVVFCLAAPLSMVGLAVAMKSLPTGTAYAVWVAIGAVLTVAYANATGNEPLSALRLLLLGGIIACVVGLKLTA